MRIQLRLDGEGVGEGRGEGGGGDHDKRKVASRLRKKKQEEKPLNLHLLDFKSQMSQRDIDGIWASLGVPRHIELLVPTGDRKCYAPHPSGYFTMFAAYISVGCSISPHPTLLRICEEYDIGFSQLSPNFVLSIVGFYHRAVELGSPVGSPLFCTLFTLHWASEASLLCCHPRPGCRFLSTLKSNWVDWKYIFFYVRGPTCAVPLVWSPRCKSYDLCKTLRGLWARMNLFEEEFNPRSILTDDVVDFAAIHRRTEARAMTKRHGASDSRSQGGHHPSVAVDNRRSTRSDVPSIRGQTIVRVQGAAARSETEVTWLPPVGWAIRLVPRTRSVALVRRGSAIV